MGSTTIQTPRLAYADTRLGQMPLRIWPGPPVASAPAVVCLHPVPYSGRYYDHFAAVLSLRVSVIAPDSNRSAIGRGITIHNPLHVEEALFEAISAGASGYVLKRIGSDELVTAVRTVAEGRSMLDPAVTAAVQASRTVPMSHIWVSPLRMSPQ